MGRRRGGWEMCVQDCRELPSWGPEACQQYLALSTQMLFLLVLMTKYGKACINLFCLNGTQKTEVLCIPIPPAGSSVSALTPRLAPLAFYLNRYFRNPPQGKEGNGGFWGNRPVAFERVTHFGPQTGPICLASTRIPKAEPIRRGEEKAVPPS